MTMIALSFNKMGHQLTTRTWFVMPLMKGWIGRRRTIEWAARSPDLTPLDFFLWGYLKNKVYSKKFHSLDELKSAIKHEIDELKSNTELLKRVCASVTARVKECVEVDGGHFEGSR